MSFGLGRGKPLDTTGVGVRGAALPPLPDEIVTDPDAARTDPANDPRAWFEDPTAPLEIEIGSGKGAFLLEQAAASPSVNYLGIEWAHEFYAYCADRVRRAGLTNARMLHTDATEFLKWRCPACIARTVHLYFSDPWPKRRHHKNRVVQDAFLANVHHTLAPSGELRIVTDHADYWAWMEEHFTRWCDASKEGPRYKRASFSDAHKPAGADQGELVGTNFERKYIREGRPFFATVLHKA